MLAARGSGTTGIRNSSVTTPRTSRESSTAATTKTATTKSSSRRTHMITEAPSSYRSKNQRCWICLPRGSTAAPSRQLPKNEAIPSSARIYVALYCLAETWSLRSVQYLALHRLRQYYKQTRTCAEADLIKEVCDKTSKYSPLRTYFEEHVAWTLSSQDVLHLDEDARKDLLTANGHFTVGVVQHLLADRSKSCVDNTDPGLDPDLDVPNSASTKHRASKSIKQEHQARVGSSTGFTEGFSGRLEQCCGSSLQ